jgi:hypothetical protein
MLANPAAAAPMASGAKNARVAGGDNGQLSSTEVEEGGIVLQQFLWLGCEC